MKSVDDFCFVRVSVRKRAGRTLDTHRRSDKTLPQTHLESSRAALSIAGNLKLLIASIKLRPERTCTCRLKYSVCGLKDVWACENLRLVVQRSSIIKGIFGWAPTAMAAGHAK